LRERLGACWRDVFRARSRLSGRVAWIAVQLDAELRAHGFAFGNQVIKELPVEPNRVAAP